jgi:hypothetical protein
MLVDALFGATADAGSIPAASIQGARPPEPLQESIGWGRDEAKAPGRRAAQDRRRSRRRRRDEPDRDGRPERKGRTVKGTHRRTSPRGTPRTAPSSMCSRSPPSTRPETGDLPELLDDEPDRLHLRRQNLAPKVVDGGVERHGLWSAPTNKNPPSAWEIYPAITESSQAASDHAAVFIDINI